ncbi:MAG TPA: hypothetical protein VJ983_04690 [candidate division Zixibacteria bacterium]|nr:hypothetical protein [candidate division Zixibacteria bacterium]
MPRYARLRTDLIVAPAEIDGQTVYNVKDPISGNYFRLREPEYWLISQLDGETAYHDIARRFHDRFGLEISPDDVAQFVDALEEQYFLDDSLSEQSVSRSIYQRKEHRSLSSRLLYIKVKAFRPGRYLEFLTNLFRRFHNPFWFVVVLSIMVLGIVLLFANLSEFNVNPYSIFTAESIITIFLAFFVLLNFHEFAHAVVCRYHGGEVREMGFLFMYFQPCFYCDLSDAWLFDKKSDRLAVTWAGPFFQLFLLSLAVIVWRITVPDTSVSNLARTTAIVAWVTLLFNFNPLIKLDGYYLLSDWLDIPNLRAKSFHYLGTQIKRIVLGWPIPPIEAKTRERRIFLAYALLAVAYSVFLLGYLFYRLAGFILDVFGGVGLLLLITVVLFAVRGNLIALGRGFVQHLVYMKYQLKRPTRLVIYLIILIVGIILCFFLPLPDRVTGEITVQPIAEFTLSLNDIGLLEKKFHHGGEKSENKSSFLQTTSTEMASLDLVPFVTDGQEVAPGDTIATLVSNQVTHEIEAEQSLIQQLKNDLALLKSPPKKEAVDEAIADVAAARAVYDQRMRDERRQKELADKQLTSKEALESAQSATQVAKAELENKKAKLDLLKAPPKPEEEAVKQAEIEKEQARLQFLLNQRDAQFIVSPIPGSVAIDHKTDLNVSVIDNDQVELLVPVSDFDIRRVKLGQVAKVKVRSFTDHTFYGRVVHIPKDATVANDHATFAVSVVADNANLMLHKGMTGYAKIEAGKITIVGWLIRKITSFIRVEFWSWW